MAGEVGWLGKSRIDLRKQGQSHPRWSPDGKWIGFLSGREDENEIDQLWIMPSNGGEAEKFTDLKGNVDDFAWSPDSKRLVLVVHAKTTAP